MKKFAVVAMMVMGLTLVGCGSKNTEVVEQEVAVESIDTVEEAEEYVKSIREEYQEKADKDVVVTFGSYQAFYDYCVEKFNTGVWDTDTYLRNLEYGERIFTEYGEYAVQSYIEAHHDECFREIGENENVIDCSKDSIEEVVEELPPVVDSVDPSSIYTYVECGDIVSQVECDPADADFGDVDVQLVVDERYVQIYFDGEYYYMADYMNNVCTVAEAN